jgi:hypothetical protein
MTNTALWDSVFATDPKQTKGFKRAGGFSGTAIKPLYLIHKATALWGSMGEAWGAETAEHIISGNMVFIKARLWYPGKVGKSWVEHWGGDVLVKESKDGGRPNDEAFKMAFTDAIGKCLVQLGFSADVHMGMFDDSKYVDERSKEEKTVSAAAINRKTETFKTGLLGAPDPLVFWNSNLKQVEEMLDFEEPEAVMRSLLGVASAAIEKLIMESDDPGVVWGEQIGLINIIAERGVPADHKKLVEAGKKRREQLVQDSMAKAVTPTLPAFTAKEVANGKH